MNKKLLLLKAHKDICGDEIGLISHQSQFLGIEVFEEKVGSEEEMVDIFNKFKKTDTQFDYVYLCTHANSKEFSLEMPDPNSMTWARFGQLICESELLNEDTIFMLACCRGGLFSVATTLMAVCYNINYVCGANWTLTSPDLATGFAVFLYSLVHKNAEPHYAAEKASFSTDYRFTCHDRAETESHPSFERKRFDLYREIGWMDENYNWIETDPVITTNAGMD